ncbi:MAG: hypothetical protein COT73_09090 [Bdellovibrio sp. CG10_big_fil_rev_8_21_14_0_10_47_8]|nr:MAG: hypothetical protein COT73_09090 [Bdellovibrio sp. CG10_big_fil_rev_8_21_14_0_10_47_8]
MAATKERFFKRYFQGKKIAFIFAAQFFLVGPVVHGQDEPDLKKESRFHQLYETYNVNPTQDESWTGAVTGKAQTYSIQNGDTLWGLSETLFGDPQFWPKIWSINNQDIENPHQIEPEQVLQFIPGTTSVPPQMAVADGATPVAAAPPVPQAPLEADLNSPEIPEKLKNMAPVAPVPGSMPRWQFGREEAGEVQMDLLPARRNMGSPELSLDYYLADQVSSAVGTVVEVENGNQTAGDKQFVVVQFPGEVIDKQFIAIKELGGLKDPVTKKEGQLVQIQGEIEVRQVVNSEKSLYRAWIPRVVAPVEVGSKLVFGSIPTYNESADGPMAQAQAHIVGGKFDTDRSLFSSHDIVFLVGDSLEVGSIYPVYRVQTARNEDSRERQNPRRIGEVKVIKTTVSFATAVVLESTEEMRVGDTTSPENRTEK